MPLATGGRSGSPLGLRLTAGATPFASDVRREEEEDGAGGFSDNAARPLPPDSAVFAVGAVVVGDKNNKAPPSDVSTTVSFFSSSSSSNESHRCRLNADAFGRRIGLCSQQRCTNDTAAELSTAMRAASPSSGKYDPPDEEEEGATLK